MLDLCGCRPKLISGNMYILVYLFSLAISSSCELSILGISHFHIPRTKGCCENNC